MTSSVEASRFAFVAPGLLFGALVMSGAARAANFYFTDNVQTYDVTTSGIYDITAAGGQGAGGGGRAIIGGDVTLIAGETLVILVGGSGAPAENGGGGGTPCP